MHGLTETRNGIGLWLQTNIDFIYGPTIVEVESDVGELEGASSNFLLNENSPD